ncbi:MAG: (d)CMP kinase [Phycisphaeraceae bacterium]
MQRLIVTLDGPAGSGKSTVARELARRLGLAFLDTGAMYRGLAARALDRGIDLASESYAVVELARHSPMHFDFAEDPPRLHVGSVDVTDRLRDADVTGAVSDVAALAGVRKVLVERQRAIGAEHPRLVTEGRDQGSVVFPEARVKFYLDAAPTVRAKRRAEQIRAAGRHADLEAIRQSIMDRDERDATRADGPLICPPDAERIDTSAMSLDEVITRLAQRVRERTASEARA